MTYVTSTADAVIGLPSTCLLTALCTSGDNLGSMASMGLTGGGGGGRLQGGGEVHG